MRSELKLAPWQAALSQHQQSRAASFGIVGMGLGKTAATLSTILGSQLSGESRSALIVAPLRVATLTWPLEVEKWDLCEGTRINVLRSPEAFARITKPGLHVINYEALPKLVEAVKGLKKWPWDTVVFDESTRAKNHQSKRINAFRPYLKAARKRFALTGTPAPNSLLDLFAQARLLDDGAALGPAFEAYKRRYFYPVDYMEYDWRPHEGARELIYERMAELAIVQRSEDFLDVADTVLEDVEVSLPSGCRAVYSDLETKLIATTSNGKDVLAANAAVLTNKLLQVAGGAIYHEDKSVTELHHAKLTALEILRKRHPGEPLLVACNYRHEQDRIARLKGAVRFDSAKSDRAQLELVARWNAGEIPLLVSDPRSIGHGLNLQDGGRIVVWFSPTYSRESYDQFNARLARRGQERVPIVYRITCPGTIDDAVIETLRDKGDEQGALLSAVRNLHRMRGLAA